MENLFASSLHFIINVYNPHNILTVHYAIGHKHIKLPLVFKDVGLFRAFSTYTNELSIPTRCVLCFLTVQISLYYRTIVTIITTVNLLSSQSPDLCSVSCRIKRFSLWDALPQLLHIHLFPVSSLCTVFMWCFRLVKLNILLHSIFYGGNKLDNGIGLVNNWI